MLLITSFNVSAGINNGFRIQCLNKYQLLPPGYVDFNWDSFNKIWLHLALLMTVIATYYTLVKWDSFMSEES